MRIPPVLALGVALGAAAASAQPRSAQLLADAPRAALAPSPRLLDGASGAADVTAAQAEALSFGEHFTKATAVGMASTATGVLLGAGLGMLSNNLVVSALLVALSNLVIPPLVTVLVAQLLGNWVSPGRFRFGLPFAAAFTLNAALYVASSLLVAIPWTNVAALLLYSLVDGLVMSGASVGLMHLTAQRQAAPTVASFVPGVSDTCLVPLARVSL